MNESYWILTKIDFLIFFSWKLDDCLKKYDSIQTVAKGTVMVYVVQS